MLTDIKEQGGDGRVAVDVDHAQVVRQVPLSGADEKQSSGIQKYATESCRWTHVTMRDEMTAKNTHHSPGGSQDGGVESSEAGKSHSEGDRPVHYTKHLVCKCLEREE